MSHIGFNCLYLRYSNGDFANISPNWNGHETDAGVALTFFDDALVAADERSWIVWVNCHDSSYSSGKKKKK